MGGGGHVPPRKQSRILGNGFREGRRRAFKVLVTGQGEFPSDPFAKHPPRYSENENTSHLICNNLPSQLEPSSPFNPTNLPIEILNPTSGDGNSLPTGYRWMRNHLPQLWEKYGNEVDLILHLGMADGWSCFSLERGAWKEGTTRAGPRVVEGQQSQDWAKGREWEWSEQPYYHIPDNDGEIITDLEPEDPELHPWGSDVPDKLLIHGVDIDGTCDQVNHLLDIHVNKSTSTSAPVKKHKIQILPHSEPGNYLCGFILFESLAIKRRGGYRAVTAFTHCPGWKDEKSLNMGKDVVLGLIGGLCVNMVGDWVE